MRRLRVQLKLLPETQKAYVGHSSIVRRTRRDSSNDGWCIDRHGRRRVQCGAIHLPSVRPSTELLACPVDLYLRQTPAAPTTVPTTDQVDRPSICNDSTCKPLGAFCTLARRYKMDHGLGSDRSGYVLPLTPQVEFSVLYKQH